MGYIPKEIIYSSKKEMERRRFSPRTVETYLSCIEKFLRFTGKTKRQNFYHCWLSEREIK
jgi:hypothetical protein